jgi:hypothetical protein
MAKALKEVAVSLLSTTLVDFSADGDTPLYTVPAGKRLVLSHAVIVAKDDAGATTSITIGQTGATNDFMTITVLSNLDALNDSVTLRPIPAEPPLQNKSYPATTVIKATIATNSGVADNTLMLFGTLYDA